MDIYRELKSYVSTFHPMIELGSEKLRKIHYSEIAPSSERNPIEEKFSLSETLNKSKPNTKRKILKKANGAKTVVKKIIDVVIPCKRLRESTCPICNYLFPSDYKEEDMSAHVELCINGFEVSNIKTYRTRSKEKKSKKAKKVKKKKVEIIEDLKSNSNESEQFDECPSCNLYINDLPNEFRFKHLSFCKIEQNYAIKLMNKL